MPELPEVETITCGLKPHLTNMTVKQVVVRCSQLRWPIPTSLSSNLNQQKIIGLTRRGKYILLESTAGTLIIHLGMSGSLRIMNQDFAPTKHDHVDIILSNKKILRYRDPRRFGALLWTEDDPYCHPLLQSIGIEPLEDKFTGSYLQAKALKRHTPIKSLIMNSKIVAGIGNIYAAEALFLARIHPLHPAGQLTSLQYEQLTKSIKEVLHLAIAAGGTTLKDFVNSNGKPGYFSQKLFVYGRANLPCLICKTPLQSIQLNQRNTVFCDHCQMV